MSKLKRKDLGEFAIDIHRDIIEQSIKGSRKAQYELYKLYSRAMFNICYRMLNNREEAEDMLQESFVDVFKRLSSFKFESTFGAWFKKIVINNCLNFINKKKTELVFFENMGYFENNHEEFNDDKLELDVGKIKNAMTQLPSGGRVIFSLYLLEGYDHTEIAQILNISESTSKTQYMRAKNRVKELLTN